MCAIELETKASKLIILCLYRAPTDFNQFIQNLDISLKHLFKPKTEFVICGDINTDFLVESNNKKINSLHC
jgi:hypothetical protein